VLVANVPEPPLSGDITPADLDAEARRDLRGLQKDTADSVARHLVAAGMLVDEDPALALEHARFARRRASRIAVVREAAGIAAYHAGEWAEALSELRTARRMGGGPGHLAVMADIERALGRPERALEVARGPEARELSRAESIELAIVVAGARRDLGELDAAVVGLQNADLDPARRDPWSARLFYAYADNLLAAGREPEALQWFVHAADADSDGSTDAGRRIAELTGEPVPDDEIEFGVEELDDAPEVGAVASGAVEVDVADTAPVEEQTEEASADADSAGEPVAAEAPVGSDDAPGSAATEPGFDNVSDAAAAEVADADAEVADAEVADADVTDADAQVTDADVTDVDAEVADADVTDADAEVADADVTDADAEVADADADVTDAGADVSDADADADADAADADEADATTGGSEAAAGEVVDGAVDEAPAASSAPEEDPGR
jgi:tetratricopeptide (TPR) repeat protein